MVDNGTDARDQPRDVPRPVGDMDLSGLRGQLEAFDKERSKRQGTPAWAAAWDPVVEQTWATLPVDGESGTDQWVEERRSALGVLDSEVRARLSGGRTPDVLAQGLRRLQEAAYTERSFGRPESATPEMRESLTTFDEAFRDAQRQARELLKSELGLEMLPEQTGLPIDPTRHNVVGSETANTPSQDNTVASQEAPGWTLDGDGLVRADVIRYAAATGNAPLLPSLDEIEDSGLDEGLLGRRE